MTGAALVATIRAMALQFVFGTTANCSDGVCGQVTRTILNPASRTLTHVVIEPTHNAAIGRLVPVELVQSAQGEIDLSCTQAQFGQLAGADEVELAEGHNRSNGRGEDAVLEYRDVSNRGLGKQTPMLTKDQVPDGEIEETRHDRVLATDGRIGHVKGFTVDQGDHRVTHVLLREGHLWGHKDVAIPVEAVASMDDGIELNISKKQVEDLPSAE
jgi:sporulation protein YlmC with PRC-barrel domain